MEFRKERDFLGEVKVPKNAYYGSFTARAIENFKISSHKISFDLIKAVVLIKRCIALVNIKTKYLEDKTGKAVIKACDEILDGKFQDQFLIDVYQAGAGTPINMNANEVIANRATEILGGRLGTYKVHPNNHVNLSQSSNDVIPTAIRLAVIYRSFDLLRTLKMLEHSFRKKAKEFHDVVKVGRTHLRDAVPITLGIEFEAYADLVKRDYNNIVKSVEGLKEIHLGGTAIGSGINTHTMFRSLVLEELNKKTHLNLYATKNFFELNYNMEAFVNYSNSLRVLALNLIKIGNDLKFMSSGPRGGINEIILPEIEPGSSIMPGKVNPSMIEALEMVCANIIGNDQTVAFAAKSGNLELNTFTPLIAHKLLNSVGLLKNAIGAFTHKCVSGIKANKERCKELLEKSVLYATALSPYIGYDITAYLVKKAIKEDKPIKEVIIDEHIFTEDDLDKLLSMKNLLRPRMIDKNLLKKVKESKNYLYLLHKIKENIKNGKEKKVDSIEKIIRVLESFF
ncbi:MAG: aspartate ammonia-lyase [Nanoarchaeota archaeon]